MAVPAMPQGALFSFATAASRENAETNVRFNEVYLCFRVEEDEGAAQHGVTSASEFASVYERLLERTDIRSSRVRVGTPDDIKDLKFARKF
jgi:NAD(P)-dependent dehydrogenase (short-subunit alcohol dehydrogenase family)